MTPTEEAVFKIDHILEDRRTMSVIYPFSITDGSILVDREVGDRISAQLGDWLVPFSVIVGNSLYIHCRIVEMGEFCKIQWVHHRQISSREGSAK